jgi:superfamily I DNA/RNA helicase
MYAPPRLILKDFLLSPRGDRGYTRLTANDPKKEAQAAVDRILASQSRKKLVVAGPGAGKTYLFRKLLDAALGGPQQRLTLTFINTLKEDLVSSLGDKSQVFTLHGYCQYLLHRNEPLRSGLSENFRCYPGLVSLIRKDWEWLRGGNAPHFVALMRALNCSDEQFAFYETRANYYNAVDFDDSVFRTYRQLSADRSRVMQYDLVLIDEFQDFNKMEAAVIDLLAEKSPIVIAGDDDQALYSKLRGASWDYIRALHLSGDYEVFELPFCMRRPEVVVGAVNDVIKESRC